MSTSLYVHTFPPDLARHLSAHLDALVNMPLAPSPVMQRALPSLVASLQLWQLHMFDEAARILARHKRICARAGSEGRSVAGSRGEGSNGEVRTSREREQEAKNGQGRVQDTRDEDWVLAQDDVNWLEGVLKRREAKEIRSEGSFMSICIWHIQSSLLTSPRRSAAPLIDAYFPSATAKASASAPVDRPSKPTREEVYAARVSSFRQSAKMFAHAVRKFVKAFTGPESQLPTALRAANLHLPPPLSIPLEPMPANDLLTGLVSWSNAIVSLFSGLVRIGGVPEAGEDIIEQDGPARSEAVAGALLQNSLSASTRPPERKRKKPGLTFLVQPGKETPSVLPSLLSTEVCPSKRNQSQLLPPMGDLPSASTGVPPSSTRHSTSTLFKHLPEPRSNPLPSTSSRALAISKSSGRHPTSTRQLSAPAFSPSRLALKNSLRRSELQDESTTSGESSQSQRRDGSEGKAVDREEEKDSSGEIVQWTASL